MNDILRHRLNVEGSAGKRIEREMPSNTAAHQTSQAASQPLRTVRIIDVYPVGVLSDEVAVAALDCGHTAFDVDDDQLYAVCAWCPWEGVL